MDVQVKEGSLVRTIAEREISGIVEEIVCQPCAEGRVRMETQYEYWPCATSDIEQDACALHNRDKVNVIQYAGIAG